MKHLKWTITVEEFNVWRKILKEKKFNDKLSEGRISITAEQEEDKEVAAQLEAMLNHHLAEGNKKWT